MRWMQTVGWVRWCQDEPWDSCFTFVQRALPCQKFDALFYGQLPAAQIPEVLIPHTKLRHLLRGLAHSRAATHRAICDGP
jgi:hypothetical protein